MSELLTPRFESGLETLLEMKKVLLLHGWKNKRPEGHWMRISAAKLRSQGHQVWYPQFPNPDVPDSEEWQELLRQESNMMDEVEAEEKICIAHSLGAINWLRGALNDIYSKPFDRVLLVAPPDPETTAQSQDINRQALDLRNTTLKTKAEKWAKVLEIIASDSDRWLPNGLEVYQLALSIQPIIFKGAGHFSLDDGWGNWSGLIDYVASGQANDLLRR